MARRSCRTSLYAHEVEQLTVVRVRHQRLTAIMTNPRLYWARSKEKNFSLARSLVPKVKDSDGDQRSDKFQEDYLRILYT